jgi:hypothetical protein
MDNQIQNKVIVITSVETKDSKIALIDQDGKKFNFFTTKRDGGDTSAYAQYKTMELKKGDTVQIGYVEEEFTTRDGQTARTKKIISFRETNEQPSQSSPSTEKPSHEAPRASQGPSSNDSQYVFGRRLGVQGHINALLSNPNVYNSEGLGQIHFSKVVELAIEIEDEAEKQLNPSPLRQAVNKFAPSVVAPDIAEMAQDMEMNQPDDNYVSVEDIPF